MSLPLLVSGADCGPVNPLQGLSKRFDQDRGIQQDQFAAGRAGSSKEAFRTQYAASPGVSQDAARFFGANQGPAPMPNFDMAALHHALPASQPQTHEPMHSQSIRSAPAPWAADFLMQQPGPSAASALAGPSVQWNDAQQMQERVASPHAGLVSPGPSWRLNTPTYMPMGMAHGPSFQPQVQQPALQHDAMHWESEFQSQEESLSSATVAEPEPVIEQQTRQPVDADELARTAGLVLSTMETSRETSVAAKFQNSAFMGLMQQLRDRELVVEGSEIVANTDPQGSSTSAHAIHGSVNVEDVKGKGRAHHVRFFPADGSQPTSMSSGRTLPSEEFLMSGHVGGQVGDNAMDAYFRQENEEYIATQQGLHSQSTYPPSGRHQAQQREWANLQNDWDAFEATATGLRPMASYQFQPNNPYLHGEASMTRHHAMHHGAQESLYESVLEKEAAVQRDPQNARLWFDLGVKQQENEREQKAVQALRRALELDPTHLASWLALAVSQTNEGNRAGAYDAIREWVGRNDRYADAVAAFGAAHPEAADASQHERFNNLIDCLMSIVRSGAGSEIDADTQIALAVLLNTNEDYAKAKDCFATALAVRPDDWLLYNRVGATLANSGRPEEALEYYYGALQLNPSYIRARFNLGISCINLRRYEEAAQHILDALVLQDGDSVQNSGGPEDNRGVISTALWESLKTCCMHMQRLDLATLCDREDLEAFRTNFGA